MPTKWKIRCRNFLGITESSGGKQFPVHIVAGHIISIAGTSWPNIPPRKDTMLSLGRYTGRWHGNLVDKVAIRAGLTIDDFEVEDLG